MKNDIKKISAYIDSLNNEKKPTVNATEELNELYATVRKIKSLNPPMMPDKDFPDRIIHNLTENKNKSVKRGQSWILGISSVAAILVIAFLIYLPSITKEANIVYAMDEAFHRVKAYHGLLEVIFSNEAGEMQTQSVLDVWVDKEDNYHIQVLGGSHQGLITVSNGEKVWQSSKVNDVMNVLPIFSETYDFIFDLGNEVDDLKQAESTKIIGEDTIAGRPSYILEVTPKGGLSYRLWVDKEAKIPLQKQGAMNKAVQYTTRYTELSFEDAIPEELIDVATNIDFKEVTIDAGKEASKDADKDLSKDSANDADNGSDKVQNGETIKFSPEITVEVNIEVEKADQISADSGSSPWKLDPIYVAQVFVSLQLSPEGIVGDYPVNYDDFEIVENLGDRIKISVSSEKTNITAVYLERLIRQDETGIWTVIGYDTSK